MAIGPNDGAWSGRQADAKKLDPDGSQGGSGMRPLSLFSTQRTAQSAVEDIYILSAFLVLVCCFDWRVRSFGVKTFSSLYLSNLST